jgi:hypothetical protein
MENNLNTGALCANKDFVRRSIACCFPVWGISDNLHLKASKPNHDHQYAEKLVGSDLHSAYKWKRRCGGES